MAVMVGAMMIHNIQPARGDVLEPGALLGYFFYTRPLSLALVLAPGALLTLMILPAVRKKRAEVFAEEN